MGDIKLICTKDNKNYDQNLPITVGTEEQLSYVSSKSQQTKGAWYFEFTHISGITSVFAGFRTGNSYIGYYHHFGAKIEFRNIQIYNISRDHSLDFYENSTTIGVGFDMDKRLISFRNHFQTLSFDFDFIHDSQSLKEWKFWLYEGLNNLEEIRQDIVSINFGKKPFNYSVPSGFTSWNDELKGCKTIHRNSILIQNIVFLITYY